MKLRIRVHAPNSRDLVRAIRDIEQREASALVTPKPQYFTWSNALKLFRRLKPDEAKTK